jgi:iron complex outermembrane receptor protein
LAQGEEVAVELEEIIVTGARADRPVSSTPSSVKIVERQEIEAQTRTTSNPAEVLSRLVPGFSVSNQTISGASETYRGRDLLVMLDGVPLNTPLRDVSRILALIDLNTVERIEFVSGASSLYGSGATGGTVNFITKRGSEGRPQVRINTALRTFTADPAEGLRPEASVSVSGRKDQTDYVFVGSGRLADRTFDGAGRELPSDGMLGQGGADRFENANMFGKVGHDFDAGKRFEVSANWIYLDQEPDWLTSYTQPFARPDFTRPYTGKSVLEDSKQFAARYTDEGFALGDLKVVAFYNDVQKRFNYSEFDPFYNSLVYYSGNPLAPTSPFNQSELSNKRGGVNLTVDSSLDRVFDGLRLTWGADVIRETTAQVTTGGDDTFNPMEQMTYAAFAQLEAPLTDRFTVRGGMRYEYFDLTVEDSVRPAAYAELSGFDIVLPELFVGGGEFDYSAPTFNIGGTFDLVENTQLFGGFSQGYALPDIGSFTRRAGAMGFADVLRYGCIAGISPGGLNCTPTSSATSFAAIAPEAQIVNSYELGVRGSHGRLRGSLVGFVSTSEEGVTFDPATNSISQQKEEIWGAELTVEMDVTDKLRLGTFLAYREGRYDSNKDGEIDTWLPNNRIATPFRALVYGDYRFDNDVTLRLEGEGWSGRERQVRTSTYPLEGAFLVNAALSAPVAGGTFSAGVQNLFDIDYMNPTASSVRENPALGTLEVHGFGRTVSVGYAKTF